MPKPSLAFRLARLLRYPHLADYLGGYGAAFDPLPIEAAPIVFTADRDAFTYDQRKLFGDVQKALGKSKPPR